MIKNLLLLLMLLGVLPLAAQNRTVTGTVTDSGTNEVIIGATVTVLGTTKGTITDVEGKYSIEVGSGAQLVVSFVGYEKLTVPVDNKTVIDVALGTDANQLGEVVVTALGIKREEKTLTYAQQTVGAEELTKTRDPNFMNSLNGKAAGVQIKKSSSGAGGSTKVVLRGNKSLNGDSSPLFVIDGVPMANNRGGQPGMWGGTDQGDGLSMINPEDIESISILRGSNAAVLYGSQGANGVILITTKSGKSGKTVVTYNTGYTNESVIRLPKLQYKYGAVGSAKESWSDTPGDYDDSFVKDFFNNGHNFYNAVTISGGTAHTNAFFSYANTSQSGVMPNNKYGKHNFSFKQSTKMLKDKVTVTSNIIMALENTENRYPSGYYLNPLTGLYMFPRQMNFEDYKNNYQVFDEGRNMNVQNWFVVDHQQSNPYWIVNNEPNTMNSRRAVASLKVSYDILSNLKFQIRGNYDYASREYEERHAATSNVTNVGSNGRWVYRKTEDILAYTDAILSYNKDFGNLFSLNAIAGASYQKTDYGTGVSVNSGTNVLFYPNEFYFDNLPTNVQVQSITSGKVVKKGLFGNLQLGYKEMLFLDLAGRNDWASTLALTGNASYFYPSAGLTAIVSEMFQMPQSISFGKVRASVTKVGNEVPFNVINPQNTITASGGVDRNTIQPFFDAKPEIITSMELGTDWRFFHNRFGFDLTLYKIISKNQFVRIPTVSGAGGYTYQYINAGEITNKGVELTVNLVPVRKANLEWTSSFNFTKNVNKIVDIGPSDATTISLGTSEGYESKLVEGGSFNDLYVYKFQRNEAGSIIIENGVPLKTSITELAGNLNPKWTLGWNNTLTYKRLSAGVLINGSFGGVVFSQTQSMLDGYGVSQATADARDAGFVSVNGVSSSDGTAITQVNPETWYKAVGDRNGIGEYYVYSRTNVRLGQLSLGYNFDLSKIKIPVKSANLSLIGNNLFYFHMEAPFDPELAMSTNQNSQGLDNFNLPATRTYGVNLKLTF
ncbi:SusC/RagA family TonB-linked outer membrane protein [Marinilongibacter aquaticus]|uniref:SusC/RagA family TonB-linked outer membrane protein n=1 Tax=Marinilongibacter aquaticus TaxID=2975157 RepID=UPI0021BD9C59|nr:SusC/RagA family TonB-linked outer membrane protein [Marinilongibacter aquaticus]UBM59429.1 SusC/RagA family TonB-linked outer membrane protein [Marinilongibacter aquaticus]